MTAGPKKLFHFRIDEVASSLMSIKNRRSKMFVYLPCTSFARVCGFPPVWSFMESVTYVR